MWGGEVVDQAGRVHSREPRIDRRRKIAMERKNPDRQRVALVTIGIALVVLIAVISAAFVITFVLPSKNLIVAVDGVEYTRGDIMRELRIKQQSSAIAGRVFPVSEEIFKTFNELVENQVIGFNAPNLGIAVTDDEVDAEISRLLGPTGKDVPTDESQQVEREFRERYRGFLNLLHIGESDHREFVRTYLLREEVRQFIGDSVPTVAEQAHVYRVGISPDDEVEIMKLKYEESLVRDGTEPEALHEAFKAISREFGRDGPELLRAGGDLGWVPRGVHSEYDRVIFDLDIGELSEPIPSLDDPTAVYFFMVSGREDAREIDPTSRNRLKSNALQNWVNEKKKQHEIFADLNSDIHAWIANELRTTNTVTPTPQANMFGF